MLSPTSSPWLRQLHRERESQALSGNQNVDVAIIGGGIAGITTAYHVLRDTDHTVLLLEAGLVAHGATGHNAGQITSYFERPFASLVEEFGLPLASHAQASVESAWDILTRIQAEVELKTPFWRFTGYAGCTNKEQILLYLEDVRLKKEGGLSAERIYVSADHLSDADIPECYRPFYQLVPHEYILSLIDTDNGVYIGVLCYDKGCMNSALFSEELVGYLLASYPDRFVLAEETPVHQLVLHKTGALLHTEAHTISASRVVLCTNGFEHISIMNEAGPEINALFHHRIGGKVGYMAAFVESGHRDPVAISYFPESTADPEEPYFYLTRRPFAFDGITEQSLLSVGGPDKDIDEKYQYVRHEPFKESEFQQIEHFVQKTVKGYTPEKERELFLWHGLMGYTPNRIRIVGAEPRNPVLLYNLGCNGVGILPSLFGGKRIADILAHKDIEPSIFDPL